MPVDIDLLTADHIASAAGGYEPQRPANFTLILQPPTAVLPNPKLIALVLHSFPFPAEASERIDIAFGNEVRKVAGRTTFDNAELVVKDFIDQSLAGIFYTWRSRVYDARTGRIGLAKSYKGSGMVKLFGPDGSNVRTWLLLGIWPVSISMGTGDMTRATEENRITVAFSVDVIRAGSVPGFHPAAL